LGVVEGAASGKGKFVPRVFCPGFARGLAFAGNYAFVGLSKPRYKRFEGLALDQRLADADSEPWCGIQIIDLTKGVCAEWFRIDGAVKELFDVRHLRPWNRSTDLGAEVIGALGSGSQCPLRARFTPVSGHVLKWRRQE
jgi:uncharacterized protein (TIGR03032 family)